MRQFDLFMIFFSLLDFPVKYKELWANRKLMNEFYLPEKNPYICSDFEIFFKKDQGSSNPVRFITP